MKRYLLILIIFAALYTPTAAQEQDDTPPFRVQVNFESVFVRAAPDTLADPVASVFEEEWLDVVGRNLNGLWFEVRRPNRMSNLGWILAETVEWDFAPERLPLTNSETGREGPAALAVDPGYAIYLEENVTLRTSPSVSAERVTLIPFGLTVPVLARNQNGTWLQVYYIGYEGWISASGGRDVPDVMSIPQAANLPPLSGMTIIIISPEIQRAQVERAREWIAPSRAVSSQLQGFWSSVFNGEVMPCQPPPFVLEYLVSDQDVRELPEIQRYLPQLSDAVKALNEAIDPLYICGPLDRRVVTAARNKSINATVMFDAVLGRLDNLEENVIR